MLDITNVNRVKYKEGDTVYIRLADPFKKFKVLKGEVYIVDAHGTFFKPGEPSYDILIENYEIQGKPVLSLFKHCAQHTVFDSEEDCIMHGQISIYESLKEEEKEQLNNDLIEKYSFLQSVKSSCGNNWLTTIPAGWRHRICLRMFEELSKLNLSNFKILDIKEQRGMLKVYYEGGNKQVDKIIECYENQSAKICWKCGEDAIYSADDLPWCRECALKYHYAKDDATEEEFDETFLEI